jgi:hypothetical protein
MEPLEPAASSEVELLSELETDGLPAAPFGYEPQAIVERFDRLRSLFEELRRELAGRDERIRELELELRRSKERQQLVSEATVAAFRIAASRKAQTIAAEAHRSADTMLKATRKQADQMRVESERQAAAKATELIESGERERRNRLEEARRARAFVEHTHEQLSDFLVAALNWYEQTSLSLEKSDAGGVHDRTEEAAREPDDRARQALPR